MSSPRTEGGRVMPLFSIKGRTAIVSGAGGGIGLAVAQALAEAGTSVAIWYNSNTQAVAEAAAIEKTYGVRCKAFQVNVTSPEHVDSVIKDIVDSFNGRLDVFMANSGIGWPEGAFVDGVMWCARSAGAHFQRQKKEGTTVDGRKLDNYVGGSFIATASVSGRIVNVPQRQAVYNASKAAVIQFCKSLAVEWSGFARVNSVSPGYIATEMLDYARPEMVKQWTERVPFGRFGHVDELKGTYLFLASDASSYTTGHDLVCDGGYSVT